MKAAITTSNQEIFAAKRKQMLDEMKQYSYLYSGNYWSLVDIMKSYRLLASQQVSFTLFVFKSTSTEKKCMQKNS